MARIDEYTILSDRQVVEKIAYSDRAWDLGAEMDVGQSNIPHRICVLIEGTFDKGLTIQLVMANKADFSDAVVAQSSKAFEAADLTAGKKFFFTLTPSGEKYRYVALKYLPTGVSDNDNDAKPEDPCPPEPVLNPSEAPANSVSAWHTTIADYGTWYPFVNQDKATL